MEQVKETMEKHESNRGANMFGKKIDTNDNKYNRTEPNRSHKSQKRNKTILYI